MTIQSWIRHRGWRTILTTDFCPWANRYCYWLKEPVGWFCLGLLASVLVALYVNPVGWTMAAGLVGVIGIGILWPWIAVRGINCSLAPDVTRVYEGEEFYLRFRVNNFLPLPIWGLEVRGYLDHADQEDGANLSPTSSLASIPPLCSSEFILPLSAPYRGFYPELIPQVSCSFPLGIWTARRPLKKVGSITVWPAVYSILGQCELPGRSQAFIGEGDRDGGHGDPLGCREYRFGDSPRHIHWALSARSDKWITTQRGGPERPRIEVVLELGSPVEISALGKWAVREQIALKVRLAATIFRNLDAARVPVSLIFGPQRLDIMPGAVSRPMVFDRLAAIAPYGDDSVSQAPSIAEHRHRTVGSSHQTPTTRLTISGSRLEPYEIHLSIDRGLTLQRGESKNRRMTIDCRVDLEKKLAQFWKELIYVSRAA